MRRVHRIKTRGFGAHLESNYGDVDMNPMLDVVFILLIFFIVTASFVNESALPEYSDQETESEGQAADPIRVRINELGRFFVNDRPVSANALRSRVSRQIALQSSDSTVVLTAERGAEVHSYVFAADMIRQTPAKNIVLVAEKD